MNVTEAAQRVIIDGQAYLYAEFLALRAELYGQPSSEEQHRDWQDDWKRESFELIQRLVEQTEEGVDRPGQHSLPFQDGSNELAKRERSTRD